MSLYYSDKIKSTNTSKYGIIDATQISGHRHVKSLTDLYSIPDTILSESGDNTDYDAIGQKWYVYDEGSEYRLISWSWRNESRGWELITVDSQIEELQKAVFGYVDDYVVASWDPNDLKPEAEEVIGNPSYADQWYPYLFDTTQVIEGETRLIPVGKLQRNNFFRFEDDGSWAPAVCITEERRSECDSELYLDSNASTLYCEAGSFDSVAFYEEYGMDQDLYTTDGTKVNILRPWETTETKYTIGIGRDESVYLLDGVIGTSGKYWKGLFSKPTVWDGIDVSQYELVPTAISPGCCTTVGGAARNFFYLFEGDHSLCRSGNGIAGEEYCSIFNNSRTYPRVFDITQYTASTYSRKNNSGGNTNISYPFAEGGYHAYNTFLVSEEIICGNKYLNSVNRFSAGISSNNSCNSEETWLTNGGIRYRLQGSETWSYGTWGSALPSTSNYYYNSSSVLTKYGNFSEAINYYKPKEQCMEAQIVASYISEFGISEGEHFTLYGEEYWWEKPYNVKGLLDGRMNARIFKLMTGTLKGYSSDGIEGTLEVEIVLRIGLMNGVNTSGDIIAYIGGGIEAVGTTTSDMIVETVPSTVDYSVKIYMQNTQTKWHTPLSTHYLDNLGEFDFETSENYSCVYDGISPAKGRWVSTKKEYTPWSLSGGASAGTGECYYHYLENYWGHSTEDRRTRIGFRFRGSSYVGSCSSRCLDSYYPVAAPSVYFSFFSQILIGKAQA